MALRNYAALIGRLKNSGEPRRVAVAAAQDEHTLEAVFRAQAEGLVEPVLVGDERGISEALRRLGRPTKGAIIVGTDGDAAAARKAVELIRGGAADFLMKGRMQTADLLKAVVDKESGLRTGSLMSHVAIFELPTYHKLLLVTDGGMLTYPDLGQKRCIIENAVGLLHRLGYDLPKVAVLAAVETLNEKMPETVDAAALKKMNVEGALALCLVEGPISYDLAMNAQSAAIKGFESPVTGDADILVVPNITAGNILGKCLIYSAGARMAGLVVGAQAPVVLTSRGASAEEKYLSIVLSAAVALPAAG